MNHEDIDEQSAIGDFDRLRAHVEMALDMLSPAEGTIC